MSFFNKFQESDFSIDLVSSRLIVITKLQIFFYIIGPNVMKNLCTHVNSESNWGNCRVLFPVLFKENEFVTGIRKKAASTSHLPSFPPPIYPFYINTAALIIHRHVRNMSEPDS